MWINRNVPCRGCGDRAVGCHSYCTDYHNYKARLQAIKEVKRAEYEVNCALKANRKNLRRLSYYYEKLEGIK
jgi:hypothetical protein